MNKRFILITGLCLSVGAIAFFTEPLNHLQDDLKASTSSIAIASKSSDDNQLNQTQKDERLISGLSQEDVIKENDDKEKHNDQKEHNRQYQLPLEIRNPHLLILTQLNLAVTTARSGSTHLNISIPNNALIPQDAIYQGTIYNSTLAQNLIQPRRYPIRDLNPLERHQILMNLEVTKNNTPILSALLRDQYLQESLLLPFKDPEFQAIYHEISNINGVISTQVKTHSSSQLATQPPAHQDDIIAFIQSSFSWLDNHMEKKQYIARVFDASHVAQKRDADCTGFSVMMAALLRSKQVPTRVVRGFYSPYSLILKEDMLHDWVEYYAQGKWHVLDPFNGLIKPNPIHYVMLGEMNEASLLQRPLLTSTSYHSANKMALAQPILSLIY
ncbi:transglutaminase-like domain-containing protein [Vibrio sp.]|nr:transglutaminase-like domain-containing protein [Vibrio sp.]